MRPRIESVSAMSTQQREMLRVTVPPAGDELNIFRALAHHPQLLERFCSFTSLLRNHGRVPLRYREIVILRVGWRTGSVYEFGQHTIVGRAAGLTDEEISRLATRDGGSGWSTQEMDLITLVDELHDTDTLSDETWDALADSWDVAQLAELLMLVGLYHMTAWFLNGARIQPEPGLPGWPANSVRD